MVVITSDSRTVAVSNLGWVDRGALWVYEAAEAKPKRIKLSDADHLRIFEGIDDRFVVSHHFAGDRLLITVQTFDDPSVAMASVDVRGWTARSDGDVSAFPRAASAFVGYLNDDATGAAGYFLVEVSSAGVEVRRLDWFDAEHFDHGYQSVMEVCSLGDHDYVFSVQRSSELVVCDRDDLSVIRRTIPLAGRRGNPQLLWVEPGPHLVALDYDTVVLLDATTFAAQRSWLGQQSRDGASMFLGAMSRGLRSDSVLIPRPGEGDVVEIDLADLRIRELWTTGRQPLEAARLGNGVVARDWKTGDLLLA